MFQQLYKPKITKMRNPIILLLLLFFTYACHEDPAMLADEHQSVVGIIGLGDVAATRSEMTSGRAANSLEAPQAESLNPEAKLIKNGRMGLEVDSLEPSKARLDSLMRMYRAYYGEERLENQYRSRAYNLLVRIPAKEFEAFIAALEKGRAKLLYKEIKTQDVSEKYLDLESRLSSKKAYLKRLRQLVAKAKDMETVLKIENQVRQIEEEIESVAGSLRYLSNRVTYATLELEISEKNGEKPILEGDSYFQKMLKAIVNGGNGIGSFVLVLLNIWPLGLIALLLFFLWRRRKRT